MRSFSFALFASSLGLVLVSSAAACGGSNASDLFGDDTIATMDSGSSSSDSGSSGKKDSGGNSGFDSGNGGQDSGGNPGFDAGSKDSGVKGNPCTVGTDGVSTDCAQDEACISPNCMTGTCTKVNTSQTDYSPVCGCDSVNYWNVGTAGVNLAGVKGTGTCATPATCTGAAPNAQCTALPSAACGVERGDLGAAGCSPTLKTPVCWGLPGSCPSTKAGVTQCGAGNACITLCDAIMNQLPYRNLACTVQ